MSKLASCGMALSVLVAVALGGCGGGGGGGGPAPMNQYEAALVGDYVLAGFDVYIDGVWYDETDFASWAGTLSLYGSRTFEASIVIEGVANDSADVWSATAITFYDGSNTGGYSWDGTYFVTDFTDVQTGNREIDRWLRVP